MTDSPVVVLPQPDSPTTPTHSPSSTWKEMSSTATTVERLRRNSVRRPSTSRTVLTRPPRGEPETTRNGQPPTLPANCPAEGTRRV